MSTVLVLVAGYFALLILLSLAVRPQRVRLAALAEQLLGEGIGHERRLFIQKILESAYSMRSSPMHVLGLAAALLTPSKRFDADAHEWAKRNPDLLTDNRWGELFGYHSASIAAANPIFGILQYIGMGLMSLKAMLFVRQHYSKQKTQPQCASYELKTLEAFGKLKAI